MSEPKDKELPETPDIFVWTEHEKAELEFGQQLSYVFAAATLAIYVRTMYPTVAGGDSGELMGVACELGVAHPPVKSAKKAAYAPRAFIPPSQLVHSVAPRCFLGDGPPMTLLSFQCAGLPALHDGQLAGHRPLPLRLPWVRLHPSARPPLLLRAHSPVAIPAAG